MRGNNIDKVWFDDDYENGNRLYIRIHNKFDEDEYNNIYKILENVKKRKTTDFEYCVTYYYRRKLYILAKYCDYVKPHHKARLRYDIAQFLNQTDCKKVLIRSLPEQEIINLIQEWKKLSFYVGNRTISINTDIFKAIVDVCQTKMSKADSERVLAEYNKGKVSQISKLKKKQLNSGGVYLIETNGGNYKFGSASNISKRLKSHSSSLSDLKIHLIVYTPDYKELERNVLFKLRKYRLNTRQEFFNGELIKIDDLIEKIKSCCEFNEIEYKIDDTVNFIKSENIIEIKTTEPPTLIM
jgi:hypothetical protein